MRNQIPCWCFMIPFSISVKHLHHECPYRHSCSRSLHLSLLLFPLSNGSLSSSTSSFLIHTQRVPHASRSFGRSSTTTSRRVPTRAAAPAAATVPHGCCSGCSCRRKWRRRRGVCHQIGYHSHFQSTDDWRSSHWRSEFQLEKWGLGFQEIGMRRMNYFVFNSDWICTYVRKKTSFSGSSGATK